jgi:hypothetical protein
MRVVEENMYNILVQASNVMQKCLQWGMHINGKDKNYNMKVFFFATIIWKYLVLHGGQLSQRYVFLL